MICGSKLILSNIGCFLPDYLNRSRQFCVQQPPFIRLQYNSYNGFANGRSAERQTALRPAGERSIYLFDPDNNRLQITALAPDHKDELLDDEEKWRRIIASRKERGQGLIRWESGGKK